MLFSSRSIEGNPLTPMQGAPSPPRIYRPLPPLNLYQGDLWRLHPRLWALCLCRSGLWIQILVKTLTSLSPKVGLSFLDIFAL